jgi:hypothetical protein
MDWKTNFKEGKKIILATSSKKNNPNANIIISLGFADDKLLVADCQMSTTIQNILDNKNVCVIGGYFRIKGTAEIFSSGKYFEMCVKKSKNYSVKHAILISVTEVFNLDKVEEINIKEK